MIHDIEPKHLYNEWKPNAVPKRSSAVVQFCGRNLLCRIDDNGLKLPSRAMFPDGDERFTYLFELDGREYYLLRDETPRGPDGWTYRDINIFRTEQPKEIAFAAVSAWHLCCWYRDTRFCGRCGTPLEHDVNERMMHCPRCGNMIFPRINPSVIVAVTHGDYLLLTQYANRPGATRTALIAGFTDEDRQLLENFKARGEANGVKGLEIIDRKRMDELDPSAGGNFAMWCPARGILDPFLYTIALAENAVRNGVEYHLNCAFTGETKQADGTHLLHTTRGDFLTRWVVNSAGLSSAEVSTQLGIPGYVIKPVKGEYFVLDKLAGQFARIPVYPAPNRDNTFDTHATPTVDGNVLVGPDSQLARDFQDYESTQAAMDGLIESGSRMFKHMDRGYFIRNFAGIRPKRIDPETGAVQDFVLECRDEVPGVVNLVGIESPGLASALPLARRAVALIAQREKL